MCSAVRPHEVAAAGVDQIEMFIEQPAKLVGAALLRGVEDGVDRPPDRCGTIGVARLDIAGQQLDRRLPAGLADLVDGAAVIVGEARIKSVRESTANGFDIASARRGEHALAGDFVDMRLERPPACKAVVAGHRELGRGELGVLVLRAQRLEALLRLVLQMFEIGPRGQRTGGTRRRSVLGVHE